MANYTVKDHRDLVFRQLEANAEKSMQQLVELFPEKIQYQMLYGYHTPHGADGHTEIVDTGKLFDSIAADYEKESQNLYTVSAGVPAGTVPAGYAGFVHNGTSRLEPRPFVTDGMLAAQEEAAEIFAANLPVGFKT